MKKFGKLIIIFILPLLLVIIAFDVYLRNRNSIYSEKEKGLLKNKDAIEVLFLGNSHANYAVDTNQFSKEAYNLANVSQSIYFDKRLTLKHLNSLPKLKFVFISIDYHSLYFSSQDTRNYWSYYANGIKYKDESYLLPDISPFLFGFTPKVSVSYLKKDIVNYFKYKNEKYIDFDIERDVNPLDSISKGFIGFEGTNEESFKRLNIKKRANGFIQNLNNPKVKKEHQEVLLDLKEFIVILKNKEITPILFASPCFAEFNSYLSQEIISNNRSVILKLQQKYDIKFLDYSENKQFIKSDFYNSDHLNKKGAAKFGKTLNDTLIFIQKKTLNK